MTKDDFEEGEMPVLGQKPIRPNEIEMVIDYIEARIKVEGR